MAHPCWVWPVVGRWGSAYVVRAAWRGGRRASPLPRRTRPLRRTMRAVRRRAASRHARWLAQRRVRFNDAVSCTLIPPRPDTPDEETSPGMDEEKPFQRHLVDDVEDDSVASYDGETCLQRGIVSAATAAVRGRLTAGLRAGARTTTPSALRAQIDNAAAPPGAADVTPDDPLIGGGPKNRRPEGLTRDRQRTTGTPPRAQSPRRQVRAGDRPASPTARDRNGRPRQNRRSPPRTQAPARTCRRWLANTCTGLDCPLHECATSHQGGSS